MHFGDAGYVTIGERGTNDSDVLALHGSQGIELQDKTTVLGNLYLNAGTVGSATATYIRVESTINGDNNNAGIYSSSTGSSGCGVYGTGTRMGVFGNGGTWGVNGQSVSGTGVYGYTWQGTAAVHGVSDGVNGTGVYGQANGTGGVGVYGSANSSSGYGGYFFNANSSGNALRVDGTILLNGGVRLDSASVGPTNGNAFTVSGGQVAIDSSSNPPMLRLGGTLRLRWDSTNGYIYFDKFITGSGWSTLSWNAANLRFQ